MKKVIFIFLALSPLLINASLAQETEVKWYSFEEAIELNKTQHRKIFIDVYTDWCGWCKKMEATTFEHPDISKILNTEYYAVKFDAQTYDTISFAGRQFINEGGRSRSPHQLAIALLQGRMSYPSVVYINEQNKLITPWPGYKTPEELELILKFIAEDAFLSQTLEEYQKNFKSTILTN